MKEDRCTSNGTLTPENAPLLGPYWYPYGTLSPKSAPLMGLVRHGPIVAKLAQIDQMPEK